jgi:hypothetical protein
MSIGEVRTPRHDLTDSRSASLAWQRLVKHSAAAALGCCSIAVGTGIHIQSGGASGPQFVSSGLGSRD